MNERSRLEPQEREQIIAEIAKMGGLHPQDVFETEVAILASILDSESSDQYLGNPDLVTQIHKLLFESPDPDSYVFSLRKKYLPSIFNFGEDFDFRNYERKVAELEQQFLQLAEALLDLKTNFYSYGVFFPSYLQMIANAKKRGAAPDDSTSLLVGALTADTVKEYQLLMQLLIPEGQALTIDLHGIDTPKQGPFAYSDAFRIAAHSDSFDVIQTNMLIHHLVDGNSRSSRSSSRDRLRLFREFYRVLKPGGIITLVEGDLEASYVGSSIQRAALLIESELTNSGFLNIRIDYTRCFTHRKSILRSTTLQQVSEQETQANRNVLQICAEKPKSKQPYLEIKSVINL